MKKLILFAFVLLSITATAQDSTVVTNITLKVRTCLMIVPFVQNFDDTAKSNIYFKWRTTLRSNVPSITNVVNGSATIATDSISTVVVADIYKFLYSHGNNAVTSSVTDFRAAIAAQRLTNSYLERLCAQVEADNVAWFRKLLLNGRKILIQL